MKTNYKELVYKKINIIEEMLENWKVKYYNDGLGWHIWIEKKEHNNYMYIVSCQNNKTTNLILDAFIDGMDIKNRPF